MQTACKWHASKMRNNGLPVKTDTFPYYKWSDLRAFYRQRIDNVPQMTD